MKLSQQITDIIETVKEQKNNLERNKILSHLEDAKAWAIRQEMFVPESVLQAEKLQPCTCVAGARSKTCPTHGDSV